MIIELRTPTVHYVVLYETRPAPVRAPYRLPLTRTPRTGTTTIAPSRRIKIQSLTKLVHHPAPDAQGRPLDRLTYAVVRLLAPFLGWSASYIHIHIPPAQLHETRRLRIILPSTSISCLAPPIRIPQPTQSRVLDMLSSPNTVHSEASRRNTVSKPPNPSTQHLGCHHDSVLRPARPNIHSPRPQHRTTARLAPCHSGTPPSMPSQPPSNDTFTTSATNRAQNYVPSRPPLPFPQVTGGSDHIPSI